MKNKFEMILFSLKLMSKIMNTSQEQKRGS